jgi:hypothetical protein
MIFLTKKHLSRRTVLRGVGAVVALPLLDAMIPAAVALAQTAAAPKMKLAFIYFPHGAIMDKWTPSGVGRDFKLSPILQDLEPYQKQLVVVSNLGNRPAESAAVHAIVPGTWLSCVHPKESQDPIGGVTVDQIAAQYLGQDTPLPSLEVATEQDGGGGVCDRAYGCSFSGTISFRTPTTPLPMEYNPRNLFQRLFGRGDTQAERAALGKRYDSVLDMVAADAESMRQDLGPSDRVVLSEYLDSVREVERRVQKMESQDLSHLQLPDVPLGIPDQFPEQQALMFDMIALAFQANLTHIATMTMAHEVSSMTYPFIGDPSKIEKLIKIQTYHTQKLAAFLKRLAATPDGDGSLYDHAMILYGSNMSNSNAHDQYPLPTALVGGACGKIKGGQHLRYPEHTPLANVLLTMLRRAGIQQDKVGDSTGEIAEI